MSSRQRGTVNRTSNAPNNGFKDRAAAAIVREIRAKKCSCFLAYTLRSTAKFAREMQILTAEAKAAGEAVSASVSSESSSVILMPAARLKQAALDHNVDVTPIAFRNKDVTTLHWHLYKAADTTVTWRHSNARAASHRCHLHLPGTCCVVRT